MSRQWEITAAFEGDAVHAITRDYLSDTLPEPLRTKVIGVSEIAAL